MGLRVVREQTVQTAVKVLKLKKNEDRRVRRGHLWVFSNEVENLGDGFAVGETVHVHSQSGRFLGVGYVNPHSLICARIVSHLPLEIDQEFISGRLLTAWQWRDRYIGGGYFRLFYSEADGFPGLIIDRYGTDYVVQAQTQGAYLRLDTIVAALREHFEPTSIMLRNDSTSVQFEGLTQERRMLFGEAPAPADFTLDGVQYRCDLWGGQKTGFYFDQRENRLALAPYVDGADVLDAYSYIGAWGLTAAHFGAHHVTGIDSSVEAVALAQYNAEANGVAGRCDFRRGDVFEALEAFIAEERLFDVICLDPPPFARQKSHLPQAMEKYQRLNNMAIQLLRPMGILFTCSCSAHVHRHEFEQRLIRAAERARRRIQLLEFRGQARDHPVLIPMRETAYLKCAVLQVHP